MENRMRSMLRPPERPDEPLVAASLNDRETSSTKQAISPITQRCYARSAEQAALPAGGSGLR